MSERTLRTIGHWTCPADVFLRPLAEAGVQLVADVRAQPGSRRSPQFSRDVLPGWLADAGIGYRHLPALTGRRPRQDVNPEVNAGWQNQSFHNYADYALSPAYADGIAELESLAVETPTALLCGEPMPWRCHRSLIATTLTARGWTVWHLATNAQPRLHELGAWGARPTVHPDGRITYPAEP